MSSTRVQASTVQTIAQPTNTQQPPSTPTGDVDKDLSSSILKAVRAFERNRQRTKKVEDHSRAKAKKERSKVLPEPVKSTGGISGKSFRKTKPRNSWDEEDVADGLGSANEVVTLPPARSWTGSLKKPDRMEVKLADLISASTRSSKSKDADFELIPHVQSVIVLDDKFLVEEDLTTGGPDEPWEHILGVEDEDAKASAPSYAQIVCKSQ